MVPTWFQLRCRDTLWTVPHAVPPTDFLTCCWQECSLALVPGSATALKHIQMWDSLLKQDEHCVWGICANLLCISIPWRMLKTGWLFIHHVSVDIWGISNWMLLRNCFLTWAFGFKLSYVCFTTCYHYIDSFCDTFLKQNIMVSSVVVIKDLFPPQVGKKLLCIINTSRNT